jgi:hypothetical protein
MPKYNVRADILPLITMCRTAKNVHTLATEDHRLKYVIRKTQCTSQYHGFKFKWVEIGLIVYEFVETVHHDDLGIATTVPVLYRNWTQSIAPQIRIYTPDKIKCYYKTTYTMVVST